MIARPLLLCNCFEVAILLVVFHPCKMFFPMGFSAEGVFSVCYVFGQLLCLSMRCVCAVVVACTIDGNRC